jgi:hypothetical protein
MIGADNCRPDRGLYRLVAAAQGEIKSSPIPELGFLRTPHKLRCGFRRRLDHRQLFHNSHTLLMEAALAGAPPVLRKSDPCQFLDDTGVDLGSNILEGACASPAV